ncbi:TIGR03086 family metal-binding protein [Actinomadura gamaensis]|uniref:TIGR03086 family metal-binding protein n=1 Tax=Actinomadura gamaensis TaxID=1763541 RepID=A0ABV9U978_9ACTN
MIDLTPACDEMARMLAAIDDAQLDDPTPCAEYTVAELIGHVDDAARNFAAMARGDGEPADRADGRDGVAGHVRELAAAWRREVAWNGVSEGAGVKLPNEVWGKIALTEMVVHVWDLAKATGRPFEMPEETLEACLEHVAEFIPTAPLPSLWEPPVPVADDAPVIDRIVGITGRSPAWPS